MIYIKPNNFPVIKFFFFSEMLLQTKISGQFVNFVSANASFQKSKIVKPCRLPSNPHTKKKV